MSERITITHYREVTEVARYEAEVDPQHYIEWCQAADYEPTELWALQEYLLEGHGDSEYKESVDVCGSDFRDFEDAEYANQLVAAAGIEPTYTVEQLRDIARDEVHRHGTQSRGTAVLKQAYAMTESEARTVYNLTQKATINI